MKAVMNRGQVGTISQLQLGGNDEDRAKLASTQACPTEILPYKRPNVGML